MNRFHTIHFRSDWPDEPEFDSVGNQCAAGARALAEAIAEQLSRFVDSTSAVEQHSDYGWAIDCRYDGATFLNVLNPVESEGYFTIQYCGYWFDFLCFRRPQIRMSDYCDRVTGALSHVPQIYL